MTDKFVWAPCEWKDCTGRGIVDSENPGKTVFCPAHYAYAKFAMGGKPLE